MKKVLFAFCLLTGLSAFAGQDPNAKTFHNFQETFPDAEHVRWYEHANYFEVVFDSKNIPFRVTYNNEGSLLTLRRDYSEKELNYFIKGKLQEAYPGKKIFGVTETSSSEGLYYTIVLEDNKSWTTVRADASGNLQQVQQLKKA